MLLLIGCGTQERTLFIPISQSTQAPMAGFAGRVASYDLNNFLRLSLDTPPPELMMLSLLGHAVRQDQFSDFQELWRSDTLQTLSGIRAEFLHLRQLLTSTHALHMAVQLGDYRIFILEDYDEPNRTLIWQERQTKRFVLPSSLSAQWMWVQTALIQRKEEVTNSIHLEKIHITGLNHWSTLPLYVYNKGAKFQGDHYSIALPSDEGQEILEKRQNRWYFR
jgi:hypothetical protein